MKKFRVHVNGKAYEVEIEEMTGIAAAVSNPPAAPKPSAPATAPEPSPTRLRPAMRSSWRPCPVRSSPSR